MLPAQGYGLGALSTQGYGAGLGGVAVTYGRNTFLLDNLLKQAVAITADSASSVYPAENLRDDNAASTWRSANASAAYGIVADFGAEVTVNAVALVNLNLTTGCAVTLQWNTSNSWASPAGSQAFNVAGLAEEPPFENLFLKLSASQTYRYFRLLISDVGNPDGFYEVGEWFMARSIAVESGEDHDATSEQTFHDPNLIHSTEWYQDMVVVRDVEDVRSFSLAWNHVRKTTLDTLRQVERFLLAAGVPFVFVPDNAATPTECFFVRLSDDVKTSHGELAHYTVAIRLKEEARGRSFPAE